MKFNFMQSVFTAFLTAAMVLGALSFLLLDAKEDVVTTVEAAPEKVMSAASEKAADVINTIKESISTESTENQP